MSAEDVVRTYADTVYKIAYRYAANPADAEDIFSETFLTYFKKDREFESEEHRKAWLIRVTINCAKDLLAGRTYHEELNEEIAGAEEAETPQEEILSLRDAIAALNETQREVITLFYLEELPVRTIAGILGKSENTVKVTLCRAREKLRRFLED